MNQSNKSYSYTTTLDHYLSPSRFDQVKTHWEIPFSRLVLKRTLDLIQWNGTELLRVLDLGCGTADGWSLITGYRDEKSGICTVDQVEYTGFDKSLEMIEAAHQIHGNIPNMKFIQGDFGSEIPDAPYDIYFTTGIPYSHLAEEELLSTLRMIFENIIANGTSSAVIVDVLARYSVEWISMWDTNRWNYRMSFFSTKGEVRSTTMTFYSFDSLRTLITNAAREANCKLAGIEFYDRSIMVGRHTTTGEFNPQLPKYRDLVNSLMDVNKVTELNQLLWRIEPGPAPSDILDFFRLFGTWWNELITKAANFCGEHTVVGSHSELPLRLRNIDTVLSYLVSRSEKEDVQSRVVEPTLARYLRRLEFTYQQGLGVGHSLIAIAYIKK